MDLLGIQNWTFATDPHYIEQGWTSESSWCTCHRHSQIQLLSNVLRYRVADGDEIKSTDIVLIKRTGHSGDRRSLENWDAAWKMLNEKFPEENIVVFSDEDHSLGLKVWSKQFMK